MRAMKVLPAILTLTLALLGYAQAQSWPTVNLPATNLFNAIQISNGKSRGDEDLSIDGTNNTYSFLTTPYTTGTQTAYLSLGTPTNVNGFAWLKEQQDIDDRRLGAIHSTLAITVSTDPIGIPLTNRTFLPVAGAVNGYGGGHQVQVDTNGAVNPDGTITREFGKGTRDGLSNEQATYGISFQTISNVTAIAFTFQDNDGFTHYPTTEFYLLTGQLPAPVVISNPSYLTNTITFSIQTQPGFTHILKYKTNLSDLSWIVLTNITGDSAIANITDTTTNVVSRFYSILTQ